MKILTWNINGIRSVRKDKSLKLLFDFLDADIICLQETKVTREMLEEETAIVEGYNSYFSFSKIRNGYSGVATFCRDSITPLKAENKIEIVDTENEDALTNEEVEALNAEGRIIMTEHIGCEGNNVAIMNLYCPRADLDNKERTKFKLQFYKLIEQKCRSLLAENKDVIVLGDFNVSHRLIDHCDPDDPEIFDSNPSRQWANTFILDDQEHEVTTNIKFVDSFRQFHPQQKSAFTCWSTVTGARQTNYGTRIDYIFASINFFKKEFSDCVIRPDIEGSDHCPVVATLKTSFKNNGKPPALCTRYMPEFAGKQQKLQSFFQKEEGRKERSVVGENLMKHNDNKNETNERNIEKRTGSMFAGSQAKRLKTTCKSSQGNIFRFLAKTNTKIGQPDQDFKPENCKKQKDVGEKQDNKNPGLHDSDLSPASSQNSPSQSIFEGNSAEVVTQWKKLLKGPPPAPLCSGHSEPCVLRTVKNKGPNHGKQFYCCARPQGHSTNKEARCNFFKWKIKNKIQI